MLLLRTSRGVDPGIPLLRSLGSNAHVWLPGADGVSVASLPSNNYLLSAGSTGYSTVDGVDGLTLDGVGVTTNLTVSQDLSTWTSSGAFLNWNGSTATATTITTTGIGGSRYVRYACTPGTRVTFAATVVAGTTTGFVAVVFGTSGLGYISDSASSIVVSGAVYVSAIAPANAAYVELVVRGTGSGLTVGFTNLASTINTGTHLTQPTTANKPLVRRGALNLLTYSNDFTNAAWVKTNITPAAGVSDPDGGTTATTITATAGSATMVQSTGGTAPSGSPSSIYVKRRTGSGALSMWNGSAHVAVTVTSSWTRVTKAHNGTGTFYCGFQVATSGDAFDIWHAQSEIGQTDSDYTPTTTVAASNPSAGKYWWSFDGSNDSLLSGNLGITNACTIVIAGRVNSLAAINYLLGEAANGAAFYVNADGSVDFSKTAAGVKVVATAAGVIVAGVPFVITTRLSSGTAVIRKNGAQVATNATAHTFSATTGARIGTAFDGATLPLGGALGWVVALPVALSDADCLTVERLVGSQFPGMATF